MSEEMDYGQLPLVYACSGCSSAGQLANALAVLLDHSRLAEMSSIAGVGGDVAALVKTARSDRRQKVVVDGCSMHCAVNCLRRQGVVPELHVDLSREGVRKEMHEDPDVEEVERIWKTVIMPRLAALT